MIKKKQDEKYVPWFNKGVISKRTGKNTAILCGFAGTTRGDVPWEETDSTIIGINEAYKPGFMKRWDIWMQMHSHDNFTRKANPNDPEHYEWLKNADVPIMMQQKYQEVPNAVKFPIEEYKKFVGMRWADSSLAYMAVWAALEGYKRIEAYGFEMASNTEWAYQAKNACYIIGLMRGMGIDFWLPPTCMILGKGLYAYDKMSIGYRQQLEMREHVVADQLQKAQWKFHNLGGRMEQTTSLRDRIEKKEDVDLAVEIEGLRLEVEKQGSMVNMVNGAHIEAQNVMKIYDEYPFEEDMGDANYEEMINGQE